MQSLELIRWPWVVCFFTSPLITRPILGQVIKGLMGPSWAPSSEECWKEVKRCGCDGLPSLEISLESVESHAVPHSILPNHTEGHRLNRRDALSRKAGLRWGKDSTGVEEYPNQDKLHKISDCYGI